MRKRLVGYPTASKVAFRHIGRTVDEVRTYFTHAPAEENDLEAYLARTIPEYLLMGDMDPAEAKKLQVDRIDNFVGRDFVPFVMRASD